MHQHPRELPVLAGSLCGGPSRQGHSLWAFRQLDCARPFGCSWWRSLQCASCSLLGAGCAERAWVLVCRAARGTHRVCVGSCSPQHGPALQWTEIAHRDAWHAAAGPEPPFLPGRPDAGGAAGGNGSLRAASCAGHKAHRASPSRSADASLRRDASGAEAGGRGTPCSCPAALEFVAEVGRLRALAPTAFMSRKHWRIGAAQ